MRGAMRVDAVAGQQQLHADRIGELLEDALRAAIAGKQSAFDFGDC